VNKSLGCIHRSVSRELKHVGRQHDDDGPNKFLQINDSKENLSYIIIRMNLIQHKKSVGNIGFMFGKSSTEPNCKLHLLRLEMQPLYKIRENLNLVPRAFCFRSAKMALASAGHMTSKSPVFGVFSYDN
jgi:hypothetical protein